MLHNPVLWKEMGEYMHEGVCERFAEIHTNP